MLRKKQDKNKILNKYIPANPFIEIEDAYNAKGVANKLAELIDDFIEVQKKSKDKTAYGIIGSWGIGKSTIIDYFIHNHYSKNDLEYEIIKINLSLHELSDDILDSILKEINSIIRPKKQHAQNFLKSLDKIANVSLTIGHLNYNLDLESVFSKTKIKQIQKILNTKKPFLIIFDDIDRCSKKNIEIILNYTKHIILGCGENIYTAISMNETVVNNTLSKNNNEEDFLEKYIKHRIDLESLLTVNETDDVIILNEEQKEYLGSILKMPARARETRKEIFQNFFLKLKNNINNYYLDNFQSESEKMIITIDNENYWKKIILPFFLLRYDKTSKKILGIKVERNKINIFLNTIKNRFEMHLKNDEKYKILNLIYDDEDYKLDLFHKKYEDIIKNLLELIWFYKYSSKSEDGWHVPKWYYTSVESEYKLNEFWNSYHKNLNHKKENYWFLILIDNKLKIKNILEHLNSISLSLKTKYVTAFTICFLKDNIKKQFEQIREYIDIDYILDTLSDLQDGKPIKEAIDEINNLDIKKIFKNDFNISVDISWNEYFVKNNLNNIFSPQEATQIKKLFKTFYSEIPNNISNILDSENPDFDVELWVHIMKSILDDYNKVW
ncbi:P-loop NTPase fold protein [Spiroplasma endosymbiont of Amphibalanus improvisus]|uniref:P-loop NTPase fold protein n=1 Tax=Spiroplasma endosymbiont of Amphibalanus improvisus TaxID=3066327 RepID=UPI00313F2CEC